jgi:hypothetical protein
MWKKIAVIAIVIVNLILLDIFLVYKFLWPQSLLLSQTPAPSQTTAPSLTNTECGRGCLDYIDQELSGLQVASSTATPQATKIPLATSNPKTKSVSYFPVPGSGSTLNNDWTDISGSDFYFDPAEHPGLVDVRFEVNLRLVNGNGTAFARLWDVTHSIAIGGDVSASGQISTLTTSGAINFWSGRNQYRVQIKSLTADTAVFESGRLRMVIEQ